MSEQEYPRQSASCPTPEISHLRQSAGMLSEVIAASGSGLDSDRIRIFYARGPEDLARARADGERWSWFCILGNDESLIYVTAIASEHPDDGGWRSPEVSAHEEMIGLARATAPEHRAGFLRFVSEITINSHFQLAPGGRPILNVTSPEPTPVDVRIVLVLLAANVLVVQETPQVAGPNLLEMHATLRVNCVGHFAGQEANVSSFRIWPSELKILYLLWCLDSKLGPIVWCVAQRDPSASLTPRARESLLAAGYDLDELARGVLPVEIDLAQGAAGVHPRCVLS